MLDYVDLEADLGPEERLIRDTTREFVDERIRPEIAAHYEAGTFPTELIPRWVRWDFTRRISRVRVAERLGDGLRRVDAGTRGL